MKPIISKISYLVGTFHVEELRSMLAAVAR